MQHIGGPLKKFLKSSGLEKGVAQQSAIDFWPEAVGDRNYNFKKHKLLKH